MVYGGLEKLYTGWLKCTHGLGSGNHVVCQQSLPGYPHVLKTKHLVFTWIPALEFCQGCFSIINSGLVVHCEPVHGG